VPIRVTLARHAESTANVEGVWRGRTETGLSDLGVRQAEALARRRNGSGPVVASPMIRARMTADALGAYALDDRLVELDLGDWEGLTPQQVLERYPEEATSFFSGADFSVPGGETRGEFLARVTAALDDVVAGLDDGDEVTVVTHGGVIHALTAYTLTGGVGAVPMHIPENTSLTTLTVDDQAWRLERFNDAAHVATASTSGLADSHAVLIRHGQTTANAEHRWQGRGDASLTEAGRRQVAALAADPPRVVAVYSSPLTRTRLTAEAIAEPLGLGVTTVDDLIEMSFGTWEGMTASEVAAADEALYARVYRDGEDLPRGHTGESYRGAGARMAGAVTALGASHPGEHFAAVSHGGATRALVSTVLGLSFADRNRISMVRNTAQTTLALHSASGPRLVSYNVAAHLEH